MTIKEVSEKYDISQDTLRYYERIGMIPPVTRTSSGIRDYQESDLGWVEHVIGMRSAGLPVYHGNCTLPLPVNLIFIQIDHASKQNQADCQPQPKHRPLMPLLPDSVIFCQFQTIVSIQHFTVFTSSVQNIFPIFFLHPV